MSPNAWAADIHNCGILHCIQDCLSPVCRSFSILNHYLKRAPNARLHALSVFLRSKLNPSTITVDVYAEKKKMAISELYDNGQGGKRGRYKTMTGPSIGEDIDATHERRMALSKGRMATSMEEAEELACAQPGDVYLQPAMDTEVNVAEVVQDDDEVLPLLEDESDDDDAGEGAQDAEAMGDGDIHGAEQAAEVVQDDDEVLPLLEDESDDDDAGEGAQDAQAMGDGDIHRAEEAAELLEQHMVDSNHVVSYHCYSCPKDVTGQLEDCNMHPSGRYQCAECYEYAQAALIMEGLPQYDDEESDDDSREGIGPFTKYLSRLLITRPIKTSRHMHGHRMYDAGTDAIPYSTAYRLQHEG